MTFQPFLPEKQQFFLRNILDYMNVLMIISTDKLKIMIMRLIIIKYYILRIDFIVNINFWGSEYSGANLPNQQTWKIYQQVAVYIV